MREKLSCLPVLGEISGAKKSIGSAIIDIGELCILGDPTDDDLEQLLNWVVTQRARRWAERKGVQAPFQWKDSKTLLFAPDSATGAGD